MATRLKPANTETDLSTGGNSGSRADASSPQAVSTEGFDPGRMKLPARYSKLLSHERREAREEYARLQHGKCYHCKGALDAEPPERIRKLKIDWRRFPPNFLRYPHHLHHNHDTDMTIGVVHAYCNAVLWQYHGE